MSTKRPPSSDLLCPSAPFDTLAPLGAHARTGSSDLTARELANAKTPTGATSYKTREHEISRLLVGEIYYLRSPERNSRASSQARAALANVIGQRRTRASFVVLVLACRFFCAVTDPL